jgi:cytosine deaminase
VHDLRVGRLILTDVTIPGRGRSDIVIAGDRIERLAAAGSADGGDAQVHRFDGALVLPAFVDAHVHLDKTLLGLPWRPHRPAASIAERVAIEAAVRAEVAGSARERALALIHQVRALGTTAIRSHVDVDLDVGTGGVEMLAELREECAGLLDIQLVAFPQRGILQSPGVDALLDRALRAGADLVGGLDPAGFDGDVTGHLDVVFGLAERHGVGIDVHLHDGGDTGIGELLEIAARTRAAGMAGRVTVSHAYCLGMVDEGMAGRTAQALADAGVSIMTNGPPGAMPPVLALRSAGVRVVAGSDNIRDTWWPYGNGDMLERATVIAYGQALMSDPELEAVADLITHAPAELLGLGRRELAAGAPADLVVVAAQTVAEAVATHPARRFVVRRGQPVRSSAATSASASSWPR